MCEQQRAIHLQGCNAPAEPRRPGGGWQHLGRRHAVAAVGFVGEVQSLTVGRMIEDAAAEGRWFRCRRRRGECEPDTAWSQGKRIRRGQSVALTSSRRAPGPVRWESETVRVRTKVWGSCGEAGRKATVFAQRRNWKRLAERACSREYGPCRHRDVQRLTKNAAPVG